MANNRPSNVLAEISANNIKNAPRLKLGSMPSCLIDKSGNIIIRDTDLPPDSEPHEIVKIIDCRKKNGLFKAAAASQADKNVDYLCVYKCSFNLEIDLKPLNKIVLRNFKKFNKDVSHISEISQSIEEMRIACENHSTKRMKYGDDVTWKVDFVLAKATHVRDKKLSKKWILVGWTPVWLPGDYVRTNYCAALDQFKAQQASAFASMERARRAAKRQKVYDELHEEEGQTKRNTTTEIVTTEQGIDMLQDDCLLHILAFVPVCTMPLLRLVNRRFCNLVQIALRSQHKLTLMIGAPAQKLTNLHVYFLPVETRHKLTAAPKHKPFMCIQSVLYYTKLTGKIANSRLGSIARSMPNITTFAVTLKVADDDTSSCDQLLALLQLYAPRLVKLNMIISSKLEPKYGVRLYNLLNNRMPALRDLYLDNQSNRLIPVGPVLFPVLAQLRTFQFASLHTLNDFSESFIRHGAENNDIEELGLIRTGLVQDNASMEQFIRALDTRLALLFTSFCLRKSPISLLNLFSARFPLITSLQVEIESAGSLVRVINTLAALKQLIHLYIMLYKPDEESPDARWNLAAEDSTSPDQIAQLTSVTILRFIVLCAKPMSHSGLISRHFGWMFPNLHYLHTGIVYRFDDVSNCAQCFEKVHNGESLENVRLSCVTQQLQPWVQQCPKLKRLQAPIKYGGPQVPWSIVPLRPRPNQ